MKKISGIIILLSVFLITSCGVPSKNMTIVPDAFKVKPELENSSFVVKVTKEKDINQVPKSQLKLAFEASLKNYDLLSKDKQSAKYLIDMHLSSLKMKGLGDLTTFARINYTVSEIDSNVPVFDETIETEFTSTLSMDAFRKGLVGAVTMGASTGKDIAESSTKAEDAEGREGLTAEQTGYANPGTPLTAFDGAQRSNHSIAGAVRKNIAQFIQNWNNRI